MSTENKTILLRGVNARRGQEADANEAILPGHLIEFLSTGKVQKHSSVAAAPVEHIFALEDGLQGKTITDAYATNDKVFHAFPLKGYVVNAVIKAGSVVAFAAELFSAGDGTLVPIADAPTGTTVASAIAISEEAIDLSATGDVDSHAAVRIF